MTVIQEKTRQTLYTTNLLLFVITHLLIQITIVRIAHRKLNCAGRVTCSLYLLALPAMFFLVQKVSA